MLAMVVNDNAIASMLAPTGVKKNRCDLSRSGFFVGEGLEVVREFQAEGKVR